MRLPTKKQIEIYKLIHPDFENLTVQESADKLGISVQSAYKRIANMKTRFPNAFRFEDEIEQYNNINAIYGGFKSKAIKHNIQFNLTINEVIEIIRTECFYCGFRPKNDNVEYQKWAYNPKNGDTFPYNRLWRFDATKPYDYANCVAICSFCAMRKGKK